MCGPQHAREERMHARIGITHGHRSDRVAVVAAPPRQQPPLLAVSLSPPVLNRHLDRHFDCDRSRVGEEDVLERCGRNCHEALSEADRWLVRQPPEHDVRHALELSGGGVVERGMTVAVDGCPPRRHCVDELAAVGEREVRTVCRRNEQRRGRGRHGPVGMPDMAPVECDYVLNRGVCHSRWTRVAVPTPPPQHIVTSPSSASSSSSSCRRVVTSRAPVEPTGWPSAIAPPRGLTRDMSGSVRGSKRRRPRRTPR